MKLIYVAGPYSARTPEGIQENIRRAEVASVGLIQKGWAVYTPHKNFAGYERYEGLPGLSYDTWLQCDGEVLKRCDAVFLLKEWKDSAGSNREFELARQLRLSVFYQKDGYPDPELLD